MQALSWSWTIFPFLVASWIGASHLVALVGGWRALASSYAEVGMPTGERFRFRSGLFGWVRYNNCVTFVAGPSGLGMSLPFPFSVAHPPLLIPWPDVKVGRARAWLFAPALELTFTRQPSVRLCLPENLARRLTAASGGGPGASPPSR